ncbi:MAG TPA: tetratricopeptide repeat protein [Caulobacteraceae bacterium]|jgi:tetratricopeptide (TPR) repeat protein|nr:tetratricopeptide repeat protein [Caulobacteraceae bacterium]
MHRTPPAIVCAAFVATGILLAGAARAETQEQYDWCYSNTATDDQTIAGCTALIESGHYAGVALSGVYNNRATGYDDKGLWDLAAQDIEKAVALDPTNAEAFANVAGIYFLEGQDDRAIASYDQAIRLKPGYGNAYNNRGWVYSKMGDAAHANADYDAGMQAFAVQIAAAPADPLYYLRRCDARAMWGRELNLALADCAKALELNPAYADAFGSRGLVHFRMGDFASAIKDYDAALAIDPNRGSSRYVLGLAKLRIGDQAGESDIAAAKVIDPKVVERNAGHDIR